MRKTIIFMVLLIGLSFQQCKKGCQKCSSNDVCLLCDIINSYVLNVATCVLTPVQNCRILALSGNCTACNTGFYLDSATRRCVGVATSNVVANCLFYSGTQSCALCGVGRFLSGGLCVAATTLVTNCDFYSENGKCAMCSLGYIFKDNLDTCAKIPNNLNCLTYTHVNCTTCSTGFIYNRNNEAFNLLSAEGGYNLLVQLIERSTLWGRLNVCQSVAATNCKEQNLFNQCISCNPGYYLKNNLCVQFPINPIFGCAVYSTLETCSSCVEFMYPTTTKSCVNNTIIENCVKYSSSAATNVCLECSNNYFLNANVCTLRTASLRILNCATTSKTVDLCEACSVGTVLTTDKLACLPAVKNCKAYAPSVGDPASASLTPYSVCSLCNDGWYITIVGNFVECVKGTIQNCMLYLNGGSTASLNICTVCTNGFYLANNACVAHTPLTNCMTYSQVEANVCVACNLGSYPFSLTTTCVSTPTISSCLEYSADGLSCQKCAAGFYASGNACIAIPVAFSNCEIFDGVRCARCNAGFMVNDVHPAGTCTKLPDYLVSESNAFCFDTLTKAGQWPTWNKFTSTSPANNIFYPLACNSCAPGTFPRLPNANEAVCVKDSEIGLYVGFGPRDVNCKRYVLSYGNKDLVCGECVNGFFLSNYHLLAHLGSAQNTFNPTGITCVSTCPLTTAADHTNMIILDDLFGFVNICIPLRTTVGYITNIEAPLQGCTRAARVNFADMPAAPPPPAVISEGRFNFHFTCVSTFATSGPQRKADFKYGLVVTQDPALFLIPWAAFLPTIRYLITTYNFLSSSSTTPFNFNVPSLRNDWAHGYANTDTGPYPSVFNYKGILLEALVAEVTPSATFAIASFDNCDIFYKFVTGEGKGNAFITTQGFYKNQDSPTFAQFICLRCAMGHSLGFYTPATEKAKNPAFPSCSPSRSANCASNAVYGGLTTFLNTVFSCHQCTAGKNPTIYMEIDATAVSSSSKFRGWRLSGVYTSETVIDVGNRNSFDCVEVTPTDNIAKPADDTTDPMTFVKISTFRCAAFGFFTRIDETGPKAGITAQTDQRVCLACAANHFPTYLKIDNSNPTAQNLLPGYAVKECTPSLNCDTSVFNQFNGCGKCKTDTELASSPTFFAFIDALLGGCVQVYSKNCFLAKNENGALLPATPGTIFLCQVCKAGFFMNADSVCESVKIPNMAENASFAIPLFSGYVYDNTAVKTFRKDALIPPDGIGFPALSYQIKLHYLLSASGNPYGVSACKSGWTQAPTNPWAATICIDSPYLRGAVRTTVPATKFIANCLRYQNKNVNANAFIYFYPTELGDVPITDVYLCEQCNAGFNLQSNFKVCLPQNTVTNCLRFVATANGCQTCSPNFFNVNGVCVTTQIPNCKTHKQTVENSADPALLCTVCQSTYSLAADGLSCVLGVIPFCATYTQGSTIACLTCMPGYALLNAKDTQNANADYKYCYPIPPTSNCDIWQGLAHNSGINQGTFSCAKCNVTASSAYILNSFNYLPLLIPPSSCLAFNLIPNCVAYFQNATVITQNTFKCSHCANAYWLRTTTNSCVLRVNNQVECIAVPLNSDICSTCKAGWFLSADSTRCIMNPPGIAGCDIYTDAFVCTQCRPGFYLNLDHRCIPSLIVENCKVYSANYTCSACADGFFLSSAILCVTPTATNCREVSTLNACRNCPPGFGFSTTNSVTSCVSNAVLNCATATTVFPFSCLVCNTGFYPSTTGVCIAVTTTIAGCIVYDSPTTCLTCQKDGILSVDKKSCDVTRYRNYIDPNCQANYLTATPACSQCPLGSYFTGEACTLCPTNSLSAGCLTCDPANPSTCFLCSNDFYMTKAGICIKNNVSVDGTPTEPVPAPPTKSVKKVMAFTLGLVALYFGRL